MNTRTLRTIMIKDLTEASKNKGAWVPAVVIPCLFLILLPLGLILIPTQIESISQDFFTSEDGFAAVREFVAPFLGDHLAGLTPTQAWTVLTTGYMLAPFLLIMPLMLSTIIAAESFAGERERKTLEALIYTPASDGELFLGKMLAAFVPSVVLSWASFLVYGTVVNAAGWPEMGRIWFPPLTWWPLMLWMAPAIAALGVAATVLISVKVRTFMEAYQMSASLVMVVLALVLGQVSGVLFLSAGVSMLLGALIWLVDAVLIRTAVQKFDRPSLLSRL